VGKRIKRREFIAGLAGAAFAAPSAARAQQDAISFYRGRTISILMGTGPGGSYEYYGRLIAAHLGRHIPGNPAIVVEFMPGAGGALAGNHIYGPAPQDGSKILLSHALPLIAKMEAGSGIRYDSAKFQWLGAYDEIVQVLALWHSAPVRAVADLTKPGLVLGAMGRTHLSYQWAMLVKDTLGASYDIVSGYTTGGALNLAMENGEINGWVIAWEGIAGGQQHWLRDKQIVIPVQFALERMAALPDSPTLLEIAKPESRDVIEFLLAGTPIARAMAVGPGVPPERVAALRKAFAEMLKDSAFLEEARQRNLSIRYRDSRETLALVEKITGASPDLVARVKKAVGAPER
jgi:tripartite-type tricarboxylate transporter receptor subunit TctC